jgi:hypothetical protein
MPGNRHEAEGTSEEGGELYTGYIIRADVDTEGQGHRQGYRWKHVGNGSILVIAVLASLQSGFSLVDTAIITLSVGFAIYLFSYAE